MHLHQLLDEREADTGTLLEEFAVNQVLKTEEDGALLTLVEANALVGHTDEHTTLIASLLAHEESDLLAIRSVFEGIREEVENDLLQLIGIGIEWNLWGAGIECEVDAPLFGHGQVVLHQPMGKLHCLDALHLELHLLVLYLAEVKYLIDEPQHATGVAPDDLQLMARIIRQTAVLQHMLYGAGNQRERCTQFVADVGKETQLHVGELLLYNHLVLQPVNGEEDIDRSHDKEQNEKHVEEVSQGSLPEGGENLDGQYTLVIHPHTVGIGGTHLEEVTSLWNVGVDGGTAAGHVVPRFIQSLHHVGILNALRVGEVEGSILQAEDIIAVSQHQLLHAIGCHRQEGAG